MLSLELVDEDPLRNRRELQVMPVVHSLGKRIHEGCCRGEVVVTTLKFMKSSAQQVVTEAARLNRNEGAVLLEGELKRHVLCFERSRVFHGQECADFDAHARTYINESARLSLSFLIELKQLFETIFNIYAAHHACDVPI